MAAKTRASLVLVLVSFLCGRQRRLSVDIAVGREAIFVLVREGGTLLQLLTNLLSNDKGRRPSVAEAQHQEYCTQQRNL